MSKCFVQAIINLIQKDKLQTKKKAVMDRERYKTEDEREDEREEKEVKRKRRKTANGLFVRSPG